MHIYELGGTARSLSDSILLFSDSIFLFSFNAIIFRGGFRISVGGDTNCPSGAPTYDFAKISEKLHKTEEILGRGGAAP